MIPLNAILVPVDFSDINARAFALADSLAREHGARLVVFHVAMAPPFVTMGEMEKVLQDPRGYREELLDKLRRYRSESAATPVEYIVVLGDPIDEIVNAARERKCDLIVMGSHGRTGFRRLLMGSIAEAVLRKAPCKVITIAEPAVTPQAAVNGSTCALHANH